MSLSGELVLRTGACTIPSARRQGAPLVLLDDRLCDAAE